MSIKGKKLAVVILEYLLISVLISLFEEDFNCRGRSAFESDIGIQSDL